VLVLCSKYTKLVLEVTHILICFLDWFSCFFLLLYSVILFTVFSEILQCDSMSSMFVKIVFPACLFLECNIYRILLSSN
jgi:hypothetical protein